MILLNILTDSIIPNLGFIGSAVVAGFVILKGWKEHLQVEVEKLKIREDARVAIAKEASVGAEAVISMRAVQADFERRIKELEREMREGFHFSERERTQIMERLERLNKEHSDFINKSLEYFMGKK